MHTIKINRARTISATGKFPRTFAARVANITPHLLAALSARQLAAMIDGPMQRSYEAGAQSVAQ